MKYAQIIICLSFILVLLSAAMTLPVYADDTVVNGTCNANLSWSLNIDTGHFTVTGTGKMPNFTGSPPWSEYRSLIRTVELSEGVTSIGDYAFTGCAHLTDIVLPAGLISIGDNAFFGDRALTEIRIPATVTAVGTGAFRMCQNLQTIHIPASVTLISDFAFDNMQPSLVLYHGTEAAWSQIHIGTHNAALSDQVRFHPDHAFDQKVATTEHQRGEQTCTEPATYYQSCICGALGAEWFSVGEAAGHVPEETLHCNRDQLCTVCQAVVTVAPGHDYIAEITKPTCTEDGYICYTCTRCQDSYCDSSIAASGHMPRAEATCTLASLCANCEIELAPAQGHDHHATVAISPTCAADGLRTYRCTRCTDTYYEPIPALDHTPGAAANCHSAQLCTVCSTVLTAPLAHDESNEVVPPTCMDRGYTAYTCRRCNAVRHDHFVPATGHIAGAPATCTQDEVCTACGLVLTERYGHMYLREVIPATCRESGYTHLICTACQATYITKKTPAKGHSPGPTATCTTDQTCQTCHIILTARLGHQLAETTVAPSCTDPGAVYHTCSQCDLLYITDPIPPIAHSPGDWIWDREPTVTAPGLAHTECTVCGALLETTQIAPGGTLPDITVPPEPTAESDTHPSTEPIHSSDNAHGMTVSAEPQTSTESPEHRLITGCNNVAGNLLVIGLVIAAVFLFWYIDYRRRVHG